MQNRGSVERGRAAKREEYRLLYPLCFPHFPEATRGRNFDATVASYPTATCQRRAWPGRALLQQLTKRRLSRGIRPAARVSGSQTLDQTRTSLPRAHFLGVRGNGPG
nr:uncharacterized protein LOC113830467 [Penaeus vannamei]